mmetsp:Transcript_29526/g.54204  ORF Transcript_29526/g.54204 Transcript_29526/m.54204 type:complete len:207 (-) Transcript_29526:76-696(-)
MTRGDCVGDNALTNGSKREEAEAEKKQEEGQLKEEEKEAEQELEEEKDLIIKVRIETAEENVKLVFVAANAIVTAVAVVMAAVIIKQVVRMVPAEMQTAMKAAVTMRRKKPDTLVEKNPKPSPPLLFRFLSFFHLRFLHFFYLRFLHFFYLRFLHFLHLRFLHLRLDSKTGLALPIGGYRIQQRRRDWERHNVTMRPATRKSKRRQ